jgi:hypothetical protein
LRNLSGWGGIGGEFLRGGLIYQEDWDFISHRVAAPTGHTDQAVVTAQDQLAPAGGANDVGEKFGVERHRFT